jgi:hypothetical protein
VCFSFSKRLLLQREVFKNFFIEKLIEAEGRDSSRMSGTFDLEGLAAAARQVRPFNDAKRRMGSPHTLRKGSPAAEINIFQEQQSIRQ